MNDINNSVAFMFYLVKTVSYSPRFKQLKKTVVINAENTAAARKSVEVQYPDWQISMFWPI